MQGAPSELNLTVVRAGAGAGKTRGLVEKVVRVYRQFKIEGKSPRIVLTTFTRKATQEIKERLIARACAERDSQLLQYVSNPALLHISTIHGLLRVFLSQVGHLAGLDSGFQIIGEGEARAQARMALRQILIDDPEVLDWLEEYGFERLLAMCESYAEAAVENEGLRPAGLDELEAALDLQVENAKAALLAFTRRIEADVDDPEWRTFASAVRVFVGGWRGEPEGVEKLPSKPRRSKKQAPWEIWHDQADEILKPIKELFRKACFDSAKWPASAQVWAAFAAIGEKYRAALNQLKESRGAYRMADLEHKSLEILRGKPFLGEIFAENWDYWMIDEYQDTSPLQVECLKALVGQRPVYRVGDPQQSIYLFRGADVGVFERAEDEVRALGGDVIELRRNYRSSPDLLLWINDFMASVSPRFSPMEPREDDEPRRSGAVGVRVAVHMIRAKDEAAELEAIVGRVSELTASGVAVEDICVLGRTHRVLMDVSQALRQFGYPTHVHSSRGFATRREVMDAQAIWKFLVNPHDNLNLLVLLRSPWFYVEDWRLAEWCASRPGSLWNTIVSGEPEDSSPPTSEIEPIQRLLAARERATQAGLARAFEETLVEAACLDLSLMQDPAGVKESNLWKLITKARSLEREGGFSALDLLSEGAGDRDPLDQAEGDAASAQEPGCINLMTIHGAKGLEFKEVIVPRLGESPRTSVTEPFSRLDGKFFFPVKSSESGEFEASLLDYVSVKQKSARELEEFDRWLYVALTRAKSGLTLTWSKIGRESWASRSSWCARAAGDYQEAGRYRYVLREVWAQPSFYAGLKSTVPVVREPWRGPSVPEMASESSSLSVSDIVAAQESDSRRESWLSRLEAQTLGVRVHRVLEGLRYGHKDHDEEIDPAVDYVLSLKDPPVAELAKNGQCEWGFQVQTQTGVVEGQIDLWGKRDGRLFVVDYKSGSPRYKEEAFQQLSLYAWALRRFGHREPAEMVVVYPLARKIERRPFGDDLFERWEVKFRGT